MLEFFGFLFMLNSIGFWILTLLWIIILTACVDYEYEWKAFFSLLIYGFIIWFSNGKPNIFEWLTANASVVIMWGLVYVLAGVGWAILKVFFKGRQIRRFIEEKEFIKKFKPNPNSASTIDHQYRSFLYERLTHNDHSFLYEGPNKNAVIVWAAYWPVSCIWTLINDPIKRFFTMLYNEVLKGLVKKIHDLAVGDITTYKEQ